MLQSDFLGGVVEGFYGQAWTHDQRLRVVQQMVGLRLNTYFYAPKNDLKHRAIWRETYSDSELKLFGELVQGCEQHGICFIYGLSPGLDIRFSEEAERNRIKLRFAQLQKVGVQHFALLFDDLPGKILNEDRRAFDSLAAAQSDVTNEIFAWVRSKLPDARFLFCPTPYCDRMDRMQLGGTGYLDEIGHLLRSEIDVLWTGPEIVPAEIPIDSIQRLSQRIRRRPVIWDNLFANDYDFRRLYCGPYSGRSRELLPTVRGMLINPNNEYPLNFIPLRTLAAFLYGGGEWQPRQAFLNAAEEWLPFFETVIEPLELADLVLLTDCFYLPHVEGPEAERLLTLIGRLLAEPVEVWGDSYGQFQDIHARIQTLFDRLTELRDRELFDAWSRRAWELKEELQIIDAIFAQKKAGRDIIEGLELRNYLPGTFRGGILAKLRRSYVMDAYGMVATRKAP
jgi:protein O-GlcNAcase / histone acetyltransferase